MTRHAAMTAEHDPAGRAERAQEIFADAIELPAADRGVFVAAACAGDDGLRAEVQDLLDAHRRAQGGGFLAGAPDLKDAQRPPAGDATATAPRRPAGRGPARHR